MRLLLLAPPGCFPDVPQVEPGWTHRDWVRDRFSEDQGDRDDEYAEVGPHATEIWYDGTDQDCDGADDYDADGDGARQDVDCDDEDAATFPGNVEACNGIDYDRDGTVPLEEDETDADGWRGSEDDCDDSSILFHPGAEESDCTDSNDYNCDGSTGYADGDGDGAAACEERDDTDATVYPGAEEAYCADGIDQDCSGAVDDCEPVRSSLCAADATWTGVSAVDDAGWSVAGAPSNGCKELVQNSMGHLVPFRDLQRILASPSPTNPRGSVGTHPSATPRSAGAAAGPGGHKRAPGR